MIVTECPACSRKLKVSEEKAGSRVRCGGCGAAVAIPPQDDGEESHVEAIVGSFEMSVERGSDPKPRGEPGTVLACVDFAVELLFWRSLFIFEMTSLDRFAGQDAVKGLAIQSLALLVCTVLIRAALLCCTLSDARSRAMGGAEMLLAFLLVNVNGGLGWLVYTYCRPAAKLVYCRDCDNRRLAYSQSCPHCGTVSPTLGTVRNRKQQAAATP